MPRIRAASTWLPLLLLGLAACDGTKPRVATRLEPVSPDVQTAPAGGSVPVAPSVRVLDQSGRPLADVSVAFVVGEGAGAVGRAAAVTDATGVASAGHWTLGTTAGRNRVSATVDGLAPVTFEATATPGPPASIEVVAGAGQRARVGEPVPVPPSVRVADAFGNATPGIAVRFEVAVGGGEVDVALRETDGEGISAPAAWRLGRQVGENRLVAAVEGGPSATVTAEATSGPPAEVARVGGDRQTATVDTDVDEPPAVRVVDAFGNPVPGVRVTLSVRGGPEGSPGGSVVEPGEAYSDDGGVAAAERWRLGTVAGRYAALAMVEGLPPVEFTAVALAGDAASMVAASGTGQSAPAGAPLSVAPAVLVADAHGNPVPGVQVDFVVIAGGGFMEEGAASTDAEGVATAGAWVLGPEPGANLLEARSVGLDPVVFEAEGVPGGGGFNLSLDGVHLNQGNQDLAGSIGGVAGRAGLLRVVVRANQPNLQRPRVRVRLYQGGVLLRDAVLEAPPTGVPVEPDLGRFDHTWNLPLAASEAVPGLSVEAFVDPEGAIEETTLEDNRYPRGSGRASLGVRILPDLQVLFIPVVATLQGTTGNVHAGNAAAFLESTRRWIPTSGITWGLREPYTTSRNLAEGSQWPLLLSDLQAVRTAEGAAGEYYHGIIGTFSGMPWGGYGYIPGSPGSAFRTAVSYDGLPGASGTVAHELGHNLGRRHAPCGGPAGEDPAFPYPNGRIGLPGYDVLAGAFVSASLADYMSYCAPRWTSDYTYGGIFSWRTEDPWGQAAASAAAERPEPVPGLLLWGVARAGGITLNPAFSLVTRPVLPDASGPYVLRGLTADGAEVFRLSFAGERAGHGEDPAERHFAWFVPLDPERAATVHRIEVTGPQGSAVQTVMAPPAAGPAGAPPQEEGPAALLEAGPPGRLRLSWASDRHPMAMVRDGQTGRVLAIVEGGAAELPVGSLPASGLEVLLSHGTGSRRAVPQ